MTEPLSGAEEYSIQSMMCPPGSNAWWRDHDDVIWRDLETGEVLTEADVHEKRGHKGIPAQPKEEEKEDGEADSALPHTD